MMQEIPVRKAVGKVLYHDITCIVPGEFAGRAFKKGHVIGSDDIPKLLNLGKENIYILNLEEGFVHENGAAVRIAEAAIGPGIRMSEPVEGKVTMTAEASGLLKVNVAALSRINAIDEMALATLHTNQQVTPGKQIAGTRIIPLYTKEDKLREVEAICRENAPVISIKPFKRLKVGLVTTGSEVYGGRIEDRFGPVVREKFDKLGSAVMRQILVSDDVAMTVKAIHDLLSEGAEMIVATGGMSVDPDDRTPAGIRAAGATVVTYGSPVFPGAMFMLAYIGKVPVIGLPGCAMYRKATIFDLVVSRILAGEAVTRAEITEMGHGGFCAGCTECRYPNCGFGK